MSTDQSSGEEPGRLPDFKDVGASAATLAHIDRQLANPDERELLLWRYALGRLAESQAEAFEERFLDDADLVEQIRTVERFVDGYRDLDDAGSPRALSSPRTGMSSTARYFAAGAVASTLAAIGLALFYYVEAQQLRQQLARVYAPQSNTRIVDLEVTRGAEQRVSLRLPDQPGWIVLAMDAGGAAGGAVHLRLVMADQVIAEKDDLQPDDMGMVYFSIHSSWLHDGDYEAQLSATQTAAPAVRYALHVSAAS
jgi:hypothetical protein